VITTDQNDIKERLSVGVVTLVAARAGCQINETHVDRDSVDVTVRPIKGEPVSIDVQLKSSSSLTRDGDHLIIDLPVKNYNDLRRKTVGNARILVVMDLHDDPDEWVTSTEESFITKRMAYWLDLYGAIATDNRLRKRVRIPIEQTFTPESLRALMQRRFDNIRADLGGVS
jgi:hypothetical protein